MLELFFAVMASLFSLVNPMGAVPVFLAMTPHYTKAERQRTAFHTSLYFTLILLAFFFAGSLILSFFGISLNAMRIAGGLVILSSGYSLLNGKFAEGRAIDRKVKEEALTKDDISFSPMAMPMLSGPGSISYLIGVFAANPGWSARGIVVLVIMLTGVTVYLILRSAPYLQKALGVAGLKALTRIMGFLVMAIGIQYIITGVVDLVKTLA
ncbi:MAG: MarC family NAAT transporter [Phaeodactylibacter sp.]|nr:MarC family NAAT transporter [Phaeodactylibacter sp.]MCB9274438.1 MarC family NAAT transporter [Lewinellaceae bacterium]